MSLIYFHVGNNGNCVCEAQIIPAVLQPTQHTSEEINATREQGKHSISQLHKDIESLLILN